ncbi:glycosyltransferase family 87 protein [Tautonia plasticadhaerens]|uniref:Polyprenol-phosphate-mannose-dependent alpha-(1-2)-phosphatidylinositol mannoside mannosyltransferase n=1 Tax=Tautonia plasticadhaerens TaxID=2527974 RepID=A0A518GYC8_9BACT|nr:glycosyltransferase family 87 protein [Tautonia plasticadhaerens]QDV33599.1 hypothetical protein ElP_14730 [Tautonia plasticadhaerens]
MPPAPASTSGDCHPDTGRNGRRAVWITLAITVLVASGIYSLKAAEERSAIIRWLHQVEELQEGVNIWDRYMFPNPPIFPLTLYPLTSMPPVVASMVWYYVKVGLTALSVVFCFRMARDSDDVRPVPAWAQFLVMLLSFRPILSDLHHGNNNLVILFLIVSSLYAWRKGYDVLAGLALALAISYKVTPALFVPYFMYKRSWRTVGSTFLGLGLFLVIVPSLILGPEFNGQCLHMWWHRMLRPFVMDHEVGDHEINQSMAGVISRFFTEQQTGEGRYVPLFAGKNFAALNPDAVVYAIKAMALGMVGLLAFLCRTDPKRRDDPRLFGEFSLVVLTMLIVSERSWKHHYVTVLLPYTYLIFRLWAYPISRRFWNVLGTLIGLSSLLMLSTSSEVGGLFAGGEGHKLALFYGMFFWSGMALYVGTAIVLRREQGQAPVATPPDPSGMEQGLLRPHVRELRRRLFRAESR